MKRWKNYGLWVAIFAYIPLVVDALKIYNLQILLPTNYDILVKGLLCILGLLGIISNPTTESRWFLDDKSED